MSHIALVDDESNILTSVSMALETEGFTVDTYKNGEEAIKGLESTKYDLGLFDIKMPKMNGNEFADIALNNHGVAIVPGTSFGDNANNFVRLSYANSIENIEKAIYKIAKI